MRLRASYSRYVRGDLFTKGMADFLNDEVPLPDQWDNAETVRIVLWIETNPKVKADIEQLVEDSYTGRSEYGTADAIERYARLNYPSEANFDQIADFYITL